MKILISGGSGFLGSAFSTFAYQSDENISITWLTRDTTQVHPNFVQLMSYNDFRTTQERFDVILNLAGAGIADKRWSDARKQTLFASRLEPTQAIVDYIAQISHKPNDKPKLLISGSAIGWYGVQGDKPLDEHSGAVDDFAHQLCDRWEAEASSAAALGVDVAIVRTGVVIHPSGGMIGKLLTPFKMGMGGRLGNGNQVMSWISREDWVRATWFIIKSHLKTAADNSSRHNESTIYNLTAPNPVTNNEFTKVMGQWLNRPTFMALPTPVLKLMFGEMATLLVDGQKVLPAALLDAGFNFKHPTLQSALQVDSL